MGRMAAFGSRLAGLLMLVALPAQADGIIVGATLGQGRFMTQDGAPFVPRGANYAREAFGAPDYLRARLAPAQLAAIGDFPIQDTFDPNVYFWPGAQLPPLAAGVAADCTPAASPLHPAGSLGLGMAQAERALSAMQARGYNVVRITLASLYLITYAQGGMTASGIAPGLACGVADFIRRARGHGLRVIVAENWLPSNYYTARHLAPLTGDTLNLELTTPAYAAVRGQFWADLLRAIPRPLWDSIFALDVFDEANVAPGQYPFGPQVVTVGGRRIVLPTLAYGFRGVSYDMRRPAGRQALLDAMTEAWAGTVIAPIRLVAPGMLLSASVYAPRDAGFSGYDGLVGPASGYPLRVSVLAGRTGFDFIDMHFYLYAGSDFMDAAASAEVTPGRTYAKPLLMSEFGLNTVSLPNPPATNARLLLDTVQASCGVGFSGWLQWTWDTDESARDPASALMTATQDHDAANALLAPAARPTLCPPIPAGHAVVQANGVGAIVASNGRSLCAYASWDSFLAINGLDAEAGLAAVAAMPVYGRPPATMIDDGPCRAW